MIQAATDSVNHPTTATRPTVCHVIHALGVGGAEVLVDHLVRRLSDRFRGIVAVLDDVGEIGERLQRDGFVVEHLYRAPGIDRGCAKRLHQFAAREGAGLFHAHQYTPFFQAMLSRGLTGSRPIVFTEHGRHFPDLPSRKRSIVNRLMLRRHDRLVGVGGSVRQALIENEGLPSGRVEVVYNGVDLEAMNRPSETARQRLRNEFGLESDDFVCVQVARLHPLKDHGTALAAVDEARRMLPNIRLLIVGEGDERSAIESEITRRGLQQHVTLTGNRTDVSDLLAASDVFLMSSISEGIPLTIIEAMASARPVVSTAVGGIPEMIHDGKTGLLASAGDAKTLARQLQRLHQQPALRRRIVEAAAESARRRFSLTGMLNQYERMYREVLHVG
ncbi:MAG: glycosyltransferase [Fuerstiella sp.]